MTAVYAGSNPATPVQNIKSQNLMCIASEMMADGDSCEIG